VKTDLKTTLLENSRERIQARYVDATVFDMPDWPYAERIGSGLQGVLSDARRLALGSKTWAQRIPRLQNYKSRCRAHVLRVVAPNLPDRCARFKRR